MTHCHPLVSGLYTRIAASGLPAADVARAAGLAPCTLYQWRTRHEPGAVALDRAYAVLGQRLCLRPRSAAIPALDDDRPLVAQMAQARDAARPRQIVDLTAHAGVSVCGFLAWLAGRRSNPRLGDFEAVANALGYDLVVAGGPDHG